MPQLSFKKRIKFFRNEKGATKIRADLHKLSTSNAKRFVKNIIAVSRDELDVELIHGFNHGTAIKEMLMNDFDNPRVTKKSSRPDNPGLTDIHVRPA